MAQTKIIMFTTGSGLSGPSGSNVFILSNRNDGNSSYPQSGNGITTGRADPNSGSAIPVFYGDNSYRPYLGDGVDSYNGNFTVWYRVDTGYSGPTTIKLRAGQLPGYYSSTGLQIRDTVSSSILYQQPIANVITDGDLVGAQTNTNGSKQALGANDPGVTVTLTGTTFYVVLPPTGTYFNKLSSIEYTIPDAVTGSNTPTYLQFVSGTYPTSIIDGTVITPPIQVEVLNEVFLRIVSLNAGSVTLGVNIGTPGVVIVSGTVTRAIVSGTATFDDIIMIGSGSSGVGIPAISSFTPIIGRPANTIVITGTNFML